MVDVFYLKYEVCFYICVCSETSVEQYCHHNQWDYSWSKAWLNVSKIVKICPLYKNRLIHWGFKIHNSILNVLSIIGTNAIWDYYQVICLGSFNRFVNLTLVFPRHHFPCHIQISLTSLLPIFLLQQWIICRHHNYCKKAICRVSLILTLSLQLICSIKHVFYAYCSI